MTKRRFHHAWYPPGRLYDLAFGLMLSGVRNRVASAVSKTGPASWLDVCCGTGSQFRGLRSDEAPGPTVGLDKSFGLVRYASARTPGSAFVCGDAGRLPFRDGAFGIVTVSFGLHDKAPELRGEMMREARRVLAGDGRLVAADFENPWSARSRAGALVARAIERLAVGEHYRNGRDFLKKGGLRAFLSESGFEEEARHGIEMGALGVVVARPAAARACEEKPDGI